MRPRSEGIVNREECKTNPVVESARTGENKRFFHQSTEIGENGYNRAQKASKIDKSEGPRIPLISPRKVAENIIDKENNMNDLLENIKETLKNSYSNIRAWARKINNQINQNKISKKENIKQNLHELIYILNNGDFEFIEAAELLKNLLHFILRNSDVRKEYEKRFDIALEEINSQRNNMVKWSDNKQIITGETGLEGEFNYGRFEFNRNKEEMWKKECLEIENQIITEWISTFKVIVQNQIIPKMNLEEDNLCLENIPIFWESDEKKHLIQQFVDRMKRFQECWPEITLQKQEYLERGAQEGLLARAMSQGKEIIMELCIQEVIRRNQNIIKEQVDTELENERILREDV